MRVSRQLSFIGYLEIHVNSLPALLIFIELSSHVQTNVGDLSFTVFRILICCNSFFPDKFRQLFN